MESGIQIDHRLLKISSLNPVHFQNKKALPHFAKGLFSILYGDLFTQNYHKQSFQDQPRDFLTYRHRH